MSFKFRSLRKKNRDTLTLGTEGKVTKNESTRGNDKGYRTISKRQTIREFFHKPNTDADNNDDTSVYGKSSVATSRTTLDSLAKSSDNASDNYEVTKKKYKSFLSTRRHKEDGSDRIGSHIPNVLQLFATNPATLEIISKNNSYNKLPQKFFAKRETAYSRAISMAEALESFGNNTKSSTNNFNNNKIEFPMPLSLTRRAKPQTPINQFFLNEVSEFDDLGDQSSTNGSLIKFASLPSPYSFQTTPDIKFVQSPDFRSVSNKYDNISCFSVNSTGRKTNPQEISPVSSPDNDYPQNTNSGSTNVSHAGSCVSKNTSHTCSNSSSSTGSNLYLNMQCPTFTKKRLHDVVISKFEIDAESPKVADQNSLPNFTLAQGENNFAERNSQRKVRFNKISDVLVYDGKKKCKSKKMTLSNKKTGFPSFDGHVTETENKADQKVFKSSSQTNFSAYKKSTQISNEANHHYGTKFENNDATPHLGNDSNCNDDFYDEAHVRSILKKSKNRNESYEKFLQKKSDVIPFDVFFKQLIMDEETRADFDLIYKSERDEQLNRYNAEIQKTSETTSGYTSDLESETGEFSSSNKHN